MRQKLMRLVGAAGFAAASILFITTPAVASDSCLQGGKACLYENANYEGRRNVVPIGADYFNYPEFYWQGSNVHINDQVSSLQGHSVGTIRLHEHIRYAGSYRDFPAGNNPSNLVNNGFNDTASSHVWY